MKSKSSKNCVVGYPVKLIILAVSSLECFCELYWHHFSIKLWKGFHRCSTAGKKLNISTTLLSIHNMIIITRNVFYQVINVSVCSAGAENLCKCIYFWHYAMWPWPIFFLIAVIGTRHYLRELLKLPPIGIYLLKVNCENVFKTAVKTFQDRNQSPGGVL